jgi:hypothetical protein
MAAVPSQTQSAREVHPDSFPASCEHPPPLQPETPPSPSAVHAQPACLGQPAALAIDEQVWASPTQSRPTKSNEHPHCRPHADARRRFEHGTAVPRQEAGGGHPSHESLAASPGADDSPQAASPAATNAPSITAGRR